MGCDILTFESRDYLVTSDYFSNFWELDELGSTSTASKIIKKLKAHFARHGIPDEFVSDNGPQFTSDEFAEFASDWDFEHVTSSPHHSKSNGLAESAVKAAKRLIRKCRKTGKSLFLGLLELRNTPTQNVGRSPAQRLFNRRTKTLLPTTKNALRPQFAETDLEKLKFDKKRQAFYHDKSVKLLPQLEEGDAVRLKPFKLGQKSCQKGTVFRQLDDKSYDVVGQDGYVIRRNRVHLRHTKERPMDEEPSDSIDPVPNSANVSVPQESRSQNRDEPMPDVTQASPRKKAKSVVNSNPASVEYSRPKRTIVTPKYLQDYVTK